MLGFEGGPHIDESADTQKSKPAPLAKGKEKKEVPPRKQLEEKITKKRADLQNKMSKAETMQDAYKIAREGSADLQKIIDAHPELVAKVKEGDKSDIVLMVTPFIEFTEMRGDEPVTTTFHAIGRNADKGIRMEIDNVIITSDKAFTDVGPPP